MDDDVRQEMVEQIKQACHFGTDADCEVLGAWIIRNRRAVLLLIEDRSRNGEIEPLMRKET